LQDNYSWCGPSATLVTRGINNEDWISINGGDGFHARIDPKDANTVYSESQDGNLSRRDMTTGISKLIRPQEDNDKSPRYRFQWNSPLIISPHDSKTLYYGGNYLFKSTDRGDTWERLGDKDLTSGQDRDKQQIFGKLVDQNTLSRHDGVVAWPCITAITESPVKAGVLWAGTDDGNVQLSRDGGKTWNNVVARIQGVPKGAYVSRIEASYKEEGVAYVAFDSHRSADYNVYIYMTRNSGDSWTRISNGIPQDAGTVHVVREDPHNANLLFAGTEFGLFVTFNRGQNWERLRNGLPPVPVFDLQIHPREHDLIVATHGRSIFIMDNITSLEQMTESVLSSDLKIFDGRPGVAWHLANASGFLGSRQYNAPNPPPGLMLDYYTKSAGPVQATITDEAGNTVRRLNARAEASAVNRLVWDLRYDPPVPPAAGGRGGRGGRGGGRGGPGGESGAEAPAGAAAESGENPEAAGGGRGIFGFGGGRGPSVDPADYTVTIVAGGKTDKKSVKVEEDPRVNLSAEDRARRRQALTRLVSMAREADASRRKVVAMQLAFTGLIDGWKRPIAQQVPDNILMTAEEMLARVKTAAAVFDLQRPPEDAPRQFGAAGAPPPYVPPPVNARITRLLFAIDGYVGAPTMGQVAEIDECASQLQRGIADVNKLDGELPRLNRMMAEAGMPYVTPDPNSVPPPTGGRGGGR
jgi:hypothetical protein